ncbi:MAG: RagB/SusD family nutrient uptake outer membrane protein [Dysgonamonadaceae bacterium]|nr:RagB/SusD family nutrient uptake outer membrane protein [Dysgonamonadaceae bacterium]
MKNIVKYITMTAVVAVITLLSHSCNFLDVNDYFQETLKYDSIFSSQRNIERYLWTTANQFWDEGDQRTELGAYACDEGFSLTNDFDGMQYAMGNVTPTNAHRLGKWGSMYIIIRRANTILANLDKAGDLSTLDRGEILGYTYFMRAYAYYHLLIQYGPLVIIGDDVLDTNEQTEYYDRSRETFDASVDYVCAELERSAQYLPLTVPMSFFGRPTKGAALGLIARLRLMQASPLWNGGEAATRTFGNWRRTVDNAHYVSQTYDEEKWAVAAMACKRIIDMNAWQLHTVAKMPDTYKLPNNVSDLPFPDGAGDIDPLRSYSDMFTGEALAVRNPEYLWGRMSPQCTNYSRFSFPIINMGGWNCAGVTQKVVDSYLMADGRTIDNSSAEYPYSTTGFKGGSNVDFSGYRLLGSASNMYVNREMRFYASIGFSECFWFCNSTSDNSKKNQTLTYYLDGNAGRQANNNNPDNFPITGYVIRKFVHADDAWEGDNAKQIAKPFPIIRYAEILLAYAEALNNLTTSHTLSDEDGNSYTFSRNTAEIAKYFNMVRYRAGLPGLTTSELASPTTMQALIERENMVEFLWENRRYYDVRRWGKYESTENEPIMGMDVESTRSGGYYSIVPVNHSRARSRVVDKKLVLFPIDLDEVRKALLLDQNPGYQY